MKLSVDGRLKPEAHAPQHFENSVARLNRWLGRMLLYLVIVVAALLFMVPIFWLLISSLKMNIEFSAYPIQLLPKQPVWRNYYDALTKIPYLTYAARSFMLASGYTILIVCSSAFVGFGFARHRAPGRNFLFMVMLSLIMVPGVVTIIPQFVLFSRLGLVGTYWPWVFWGIAGSPFHIFLFRQFFGTFPRDLEDAAEVDGCNRLQVFAHIFLPNAGPVLAASAIFSFQGVWGDFFLPALLLNQQRLTLAVKLAKAYVDPAGNPLYTQTMAAIIIFVLPLVVLFFIAQRYIVRGIVTTGLK
jgi:multiple sugar transport system permease protein